MLLTRIFFNKLTLSGRPAQDGPAKRGDTEPKSPDALEGEAHQIRTHGNKGPAVPSPRLSPQKASRSATYFSMADTSLVLNFPLVSSSGVIRPSNKRPSLAILTRISRTSSPRYMPLIIFSNLQEKSARVLVQSFLGRLRRSETDTEGEEASCLASPQPHWQARPCT